MTRSESAHGASWVRPASGVRILDRGARREAEGTRSKNPMPRATPFPRLAPQRAPHTTAVRPVTIEGSPAMRYRTAVVVPPSRYEVILVSSGVRCRLRGRDRIALTNA